MRVAVLQDRVEQISLLLQAGIVGRSSRDVGSVTTEAAQLCRELADQIAGPIETLRLRGGGV
jgi:hypothetical protein